MKVFLTVLCSLFTISSLSGCWLFAVGAGAEAGYVGAQEKRTASETVSDQSITTSIKAKYLADSTIPGMKINVDTFKSRVTLRGYVPTQDDADRAVRIARETGGVASVDSRLVVDPSLRG